MKKILITAMGPGEISQGMAFARYAVKFGYCIDFVIFDEIYSNIVGLNDSNFNLIIQTDGFSGLTKQVDSSKPDLVILCNSKIFSEHKSFFDQSPWPEIPTISIDSNWLFTKESPYKSLPWVDVYCVNIPKPVFEYGLVAGGGNYDITMDSMQKIRVVGLLPSYEKLSDDAVLSQKNKFGIENNEKLVFMYASTASLSGESQSMIMKKGIDAVSNLLAKGHKIKLINIGRIPKDISSIECDWLINNEHVSTEDFHGLLASADLVFQHQGLGTLEQAIAATTPVIANIRELKDEPALNHAHLWEVMPFVKYGAAAMLYFSDSIEKTTDEIESLLYDQNRVSAMKERQSELYECGEANVMSVVNELLESKSKKS